MVSERIEDDHGNFIETGRRKKKGSTPRRNLRADVDSVTSSTKTGHQETDGPRAKFEQRRGGPDAVRVFAQNKRGAE